MDNTYMWLDNVLHVHTLKTHKDMTTGIERYKQELRDYVAWTNSLQVPRGMGAMQALDNNQWDKCQNWNSKLIGMEDALGLTKEQIKEIEIECGVKQSTI